jgi:carbamoyl-phosphate synthase large subunit
MNVLITSASRKVTLVRAFQRALALEQGGEVIAIDVSPYSAALQVADRGFVVPRTDAPEFGGVLEKVCVKQDIGLLVPTRDEELLYYAEAAKRFGELGVTVAVAAPEVVRTCQDKWLFADFCNAHAFSVPETYLASDLSRATANHSALFIKERRGKGSRNVLKVDAHDDIPAALRRFSTPLIQEYIAGPEYTVDLFADFSGNVISVVPRERILTFGGESIIGRTCKDSRIMEEAVRLSTALGLVAHNTIQCCATGNSISFFEVNPRYGGGANLGFAAGAPTPHYLVRLVAKKPVPAAIGQFRDGYVMMRYMEDLHMDDLAVQGTETLG